MHTLNEEHSDANISRNRQQVQSPSCESHLFNGANSASRSLERIQQYLRIEHEPKNTPEGVPPAYWPASGNLSVEKLSARYSEVQSSMLLPLKTLITSFVGRHESATRHIVRSRLRRAHRNRRPYWKWEGMWFPNYTVHYPAQQSTELAHAVAAALYSHGGQHPIRWATD